MARIVAGVATSHIPAVGAAMTMTSTNTLTSRPVFAVASARRVLLEAKAVGVFTPLPRQNA